MLPGCSEGFLRKYSVLMKDSEKKPRKGLEWAKAGQPGLKKPKAVWSGKQRQATLKIPVSQKVGMPNEI